MHVDTRKEIWHPLSKHKQERSKQVTSLKPCVQQAQQISGRSLWLKRNYRELLLTLLAHMQLWRRAWNISRWRSSATCGDSSLNSATLSWTTTPAASSCTPVLTGWSRTWTSRRTWTTSARRCSSPLHLTPRGNKSKTCCLRALQRRSVPAGSRARSPVRGARRATPLATRTRHITSATVPVRWTVTGGPGHACACSRGPAWATTICSSTRTQLVPGIGWPPGLHAVGPPEASAREPREERWSRDVVDYTRETRHKMISAYKFKLNV